MSLIFIYSCSNDDHKNEDGTSDSTDLYMDIDATFNFIPVDADGNNLLKAENMLTIDDFDIVLYDKKGKPYYFYDPMLGDPKNISITGEWGGNDWVCVYLDGPKDEVSNTGITYLRICNDIHIIKTEWDISFEGTDDENVIGGGYSIEVKKIWFDNELVVDKGASVYMPAIVIERN